MPFLRAFRERYPDVPIDPYLARQLQYHQTRRAEALLASAMIAIATALLWAGDTFALPSFARVAAFSAELDLSEVTVGLLIGAVGGLRLWALWRNGRTNMPLLRLAGSIVGFMFWAGWVWAFVMTYPPMVPLLPIAALFAAHEFITAGLVTRDVYAFNSLGLRKRYDLANG